MNMPSLKTLFRSVVAFGSGCRRLYGLMLNNGRTSPFLNLPTELQLLIIQELPDASRASIVLTCKTLFTLQSSSTPFEALKLPREQPANIQSIPMSKPDLYHSRRWEFLTLLERDLKGTWLRCSECLVLHPKEMFAAYERSIVPWLDSYYRANAPEYRSCRHGRGSLCIGKRAPFRPSGIVDICPCIKLTIGQKLQLETKLAQLLYYPGSSGHPKADYLVHECRHSYGPIEIDVCVRFFLYDGTWLSSGPGNESRDIPFTRIPRHDPEPGSLGVLLKYRHTYPSRPLTYPSEPPLSVPRLLCPHKNLQGAIEDLSRHQMIHQYPESKCGYCENQVEHCGSCVTKVVEFQRVENIPASMTTCTYQVERCLDNDYWPMETVFPLARRQTPLKGSLIDRT